MKICLIALLVCVLLLSAVGCDRTVSDASDPTDNYETFFTDIYLCDDVYRTADTPTHGSGTIALPVFQDSLMVKDCQLLLCRDGCELTAVVSRASQGYAAVSEVVLDGEFEGNFNVFEFKMKIPEEMAEGWKDQGAYDEMLQRMEGNYYYLLALGENRYAYLHLARKEGGEKAEQEVDLADSIAREARIYIDS